MAQTRRKRRTKHRGTAAGTVVTRGRTGRKPTGEEKPAGRAGAGARQRRTPRYEQPPTWKGAAQRAAIVTPLFIVVLLLFRQPIVGAVFMLPFIFGLYTVMGYYTDLMMHRRWLRKREAGR